MFCITSIKRALINKQELHYAEQLKKQIKTQ